MAADSSDGNTNHSSSPSGSEASPQSRQRGLQSPWSKVVRRGGETESSSPAAGSPSSSPLAIASPDGVVLAQAPPPPSEPENSGPEILPEGSDDSNGNAARSKKPAWNKPLNGAAEGNSVMGGSVSWPALSESTRPGAKLSSDSLKPPPPPDGPASSSQGPIISQAPQKQANNSSNSNSNTNSAANHGVTRQKSMKHRGSGSGQGGFNRPPPPPPPMPPPFPVLIEMPPYGNYGNFVPPVLDSSVRGSRPLSGVGSQAGNDHSTHSQRNTSRRNNYSGRPRGDGQYHNNHGGRRDHDRRDIHLSHQFVAPPPPPPPPPGSFMPPPPPPPPGSAAFIGPPPMRPFMGPLGFDMSSPYVYVPTLSTFIPPAPSALMFFTVDPLPALIIKQIDYYFSDANLVKDDFLRSNMDEEGWVPINLIASFPRVQQLTADISFILDSLRASMVVEVKGDKMRRRNDWKRWIHTGSHHSPDSGSLTPGRTSHDILATSINKISISEVTSSNRDVLDSKHLEQELAQDRHVPEKSAGSSTVANGDVSAGEFHES